MGVRFSRRIKICKGVHLNVSKSGVGVSLGGRGSSISIGPKGTYVNTSIPGTGIFYRQKLSSSGVQKNYNVKNLRELEVIPGSTFHFQIEDDGSESFFFLDPDGNPFTNEILMRKMRKSDECKRIVEEIRKAKADLIQEQNNSIVYIFKSTPKTITAEEVKRERDNQNSVIKNTYTVREFDEPKPSIGIHYEEAHQFAVDHVKTMKFWKRKNLIDSMTQEKMSELHQTDMAAWNVRKQEFDIEEQKIKKEKDFEYEEAYKKAVEEKSRIYEQILNPDEDYLMETISDVLSQIELPLDFSVDYALSGKTIELDIDLPKIEDYPQTTANILQSGKISIKKKINSVLNKDYATSVTGIAFYFAGLLFNISPVIENIIVSGYSQRLNTKNGNLEDQWIYNVNFVRNEFSKLNIENIDPIQAFSNFEHTIDCSSKFELKEIEQNKSINRNSDIKSQQVQTKYFRIESEKKEEPICVLDGSLSSGNSSVIQQGENNYVERERYQNKLKYQQKEMQENYKKAKKGCLIFIFIIIALFVGVVSYCSWDIKENYTRTSTGKLMRIK